MTTALSRPGGVRHESTIGNPTIDDASRAMRDALRSIARDIPDPKRYASWAPLWVCEALLRASLHNGNEWLAAPNDAPDLKPLGLVEAGQGKRGLTAFAIGVRKALMREEL